MILLPQRFVFILLLIGIHLSIQAQAHYAPKNVFSHNDYAQTKPFYDAYRQRVGYIEVDVFLQGQDLLVAHQANELMADRTIESMYLMPLQLEVTTHKGRIYPRRSQHLGLSIDIKTEGMSTLSRIVNVLEKYPDLLHARGFTILVSGNVPDPGQWALFPEFIHFDGRPDTEYTPAQWQRIGMVSNDFKKYSRWDGQGAISVADDEMIKSVLTQIHVRKKKFRFWASPDTPGAWHYLQSRGVDIIGTDTVQELIHYLKTNRK
ncbi:MAG: hypothetical protein IPF70_12090 [Saprospiraceae bacterium]|jgi:alkaline phosphatase|nr:hypothetical protein [Saprospiraceae bacterium]MBK9681561.1 hypothetical protein [Saprospiraceae bacterium]MBL0110698.1 hypothetical protein [Saprospiraceae bacterium]